MTEPDPKKRASPNAPTVEVPAWTVTTAATRTSSGPPRSPSMLDSSWLDADTDSGRTTDAAIEIPAKYRAPTKNRALLRVVDGFNAGQVFPLDQRETIIGRGRDCTVRLEDSGVSRRHTRIVHEMDGQYFVEDLGSLNGTYVSSQKVTRQKLNTGDRVQIGPNVSLSFSVIDEAEERLAKQLFESSTRDGLTKAYNRKYFVERLASEAAYATRHKTRLALILFDIDFFKKVNDTYGHVAGDEVLRGISTTVTRLIRAEDVFARYGGEEFVIIVRGIELSNVAKFAGRVRAAVESHPTTWADESIAATISVGVAGLDECGDSGTSEALLMLADERLYEAKRTGRNRVVS
jgi:two-component system cell cycle response regulator